MDFWDFVPPLNLRTPTRRRGLRPNIPKRVENDRLIYYLKGGLRFFEKFAQAPIRILIKVQNIERSGFAPELGGEALSSEAFLLRVLICLFLFVVFVLLGVRLFLFLYLCFAFFCFCFVFLCVCFCFQWFVVRFLMIFVTKNRLFWTKN